MMSCRSVLKMMQQGSQSLPVSETGGLHKQRPGIRRRLSSLSLNLKIQPSPTAAEWAFRRSKSLSSLGENAGDSIRKWWDWGWGWILSRKPTFAADLEMNEEETATLGSHNKGSWRHVFFKVTSQLRRKLSRSDDVGLPQTIRYS
ncbi:hypothetical protein F511_12173 [Dorcoceras hygrometricum]|uniref:Uncharacterized protein n=1 Tax=Dorcoceras hygrometricum TaxID=472368 RepID=A0A2Z7BTK8_9LAMI|nr:hypothetical protein F511_12173 [Dorcoceras hygrometricum]